MLTFTILLITHYSINVYAATEEYTTYSEIMMSEGKLLMNFTDEEMDKMLGYTQKRMYETSRNPYYMYRQKNISGNLENVGYAKEGYHSFYNINIMEEVQNIIAVGGGGVSKLVKGDRIERIFNFKDPCEYIRRFDEIIDKKDEFYKIYNEM